MELIDPHIAGVEVTLDGLTEDANITTSSIFNFSSDTAAKLIEDWYKANAQTLSQRSTIALLCLYVPVFLFSLAGNSFVIALFIKDRRMRRSKSLFLVNLALADEAVTIVCIPLVIGQTVNRLWSYGDILCKVTGFMQVVTVACSIFTLTALSIDHYASVRSPRRRDKSLDSGQRPTVVLLVAIWLVAAVLSGPVLHVRRVTRPDLGTYTLSERAMFCVEEWPTSEIRHAYAVFLLLATYVGPIGIIIASYALISRTLYIGSPTGSASASALRPRLASANSNNGICTRNAGIAVAGLAGCCDDARGTAMPVAHQPLVTLQSPVATSPTAAQSPQHVQQSAEVVFEVVLSNRGTRGGLLHPVACSSYARGMPAGATLCSSPSLTLHGPNIVPATGTSSGSNTSVAGLNGCGNQQQGDLGAVGSGRSSLVFQPTLLPNACTCNSSPSTSSGSTRKQRSSGLNQSIDPVVSGLAAGGGAAVTVPRATSLHAVTLHAVGCRYTAAGGTATGVAVLPASGAAPSVHDSVSRNRRAIVRLLVAIVIVFVASWLPYNVVSLHVDFNLDSDYARVVPFALWFGHAHSAVNPIVYWFFNKTFRNCLRNALQSGFRACNRKRSPRDARASQFV